MRGSEGRVLAVGGGGALFGGPVRLESGWLDVGSGGTDAAAKRVALQFLSVACTLSVAGSGRGV